METLRKEMKTEEAHRLKVYVEQMCEELREHMKVNADSLVHYFYEDTVSLLEYFPKDKTLYVLDEITRLEEKGKAVEFEFRESMMQRLEKGYILPKQAELLFTMEQVRSMLGGRRVLALSTLEPKAGSWKLSTNCQITASSIVSYNNSFETLLKDLERYTGVNPKPTDFDEYWDNSIAEMKAMDPQVVMKKAEFQSPVVECYDMYFTGVNGARIHVKHLRPRKITDKIPAVLQFQQTLPHGASYTGNYHQPS